MKTLTASQFAERARAVVPGRSRGEIIKNKWPQCLLEKIVEPEIWVITSEYQYF
jgi:hypothetical protein